MYYRRPCKIQISECRQPSVISRQHASPYPVPIDRVYQQSRNSGSNKERRCPRSLGHCPSEYRYSHCCEHDLHENKTVSEQPILIKPRQKEEASACKCKGLPEHYAKTRRTKKQTRDHKRHEIFYRYRYDIFALYRTNFKACESSLHEEYHGSAYEHPKEIHIVHGYILDSLGKNVKLPAANI